MKNFAALGMAFAVAFFMVLPSAHAALIGVTPSYPDITTSGSDINYAWTAGTGGTLTINGSSGPGAAYVNQTVKFFSGDTPHYICQGTTSSCNVSSTYSLTANFNASGTFTSGSLTVLGYVDASSTSGYQAYDWNGAAAGGAPTGTLLTANLTGFGFRSNTGGSVTYNSVISYNDRLLLDFTIQATGGDFLTAGYTGHGLKWSGDVYSGSSAPYAKPYGSDWDLQAAPFTKSFACGNGDNNNRPCSATLNTFVPVPAAVWLFGPGLVGLMGFAARSRKARTG